MIALAASYLLIGYLLISGVLFRFVTVIFIPLKKFQRTKTDEITFAVLASIAPFVLALIVVWYTPVGHIGNSWVDSTALKMSDYRTILLSNYADDRIGFWDSLVRVAVRQLRLLVVFYLR